MGNIFSTEPESLRITNTDIKSQIEKLEREINEQKLMKKAQMMTEFEKDLDAIYQKIIYFVTHRQMKILDENTVSISFIYERPLKSILKNFYDPDPTRKFYDNTHALEYLHGKYPESKIIKSIKLESHLYDSYNGDYSGYDVETIVTANDNSQ